jgi:NCS2 family nucleobase:cation symporter-2
VKKPANLIYGLEDVPPAGVTLLLALQHLIVVLIYLVVPVVVAQTAGASPARVEHLVGMTLLALAIGALLQSFPRGPIGSGLLCPPTCTAAYLSPALLAAKAGGLPLVFGMTVVAGLFEILLSRLLPRLRGIFTPAVSGFVVLVIGLSILLLAAQKFLGMDQLHPSRARELLTAGLTLGLTAGLSVWAKGTLRLYCVLIGMVAGYLTAWGLGLIDAADQMQLRSAAIVRLPHLGSIGWSLDAGLLVPFLIGSVAASLKAIGVISSAQKMNDAEWRRPEMRSLGRGVLADGLGTVVAGMVGSVGLNTSPSSVGLASATGATSRRIGYVLSGMLLLLALCPKVATVFAIMPEPVIGAGLAFTGSFVVANGLEVLAAHPLDARKTLVIGTALMFGLSRTVFPAIYAHVPVALHPFVQSDLSLEIAVALLLTLIFRIGIRRHAALTLEPDKGASDAVRQFLDKHQSEWSAPKDAFERAAGAAATALDAVVTQQRATGPITLAASFDAVDLRLELSYPGAPPERAGEGYGADEESFVTSQEGISQLRLRIAG